MQRGGCLPAGWRMDVHQSSALPGAKGNLFCFDFPGSQGCKATKTIRGDTPDESKPPQLNLKTIGGGLPMLDTYTQKQHALSRFRMSWICCCSRMRTNLRRSVRATAGREAIGRGKKCVGNPWTQSSPPRNDFAHETEKGGKHFCVHATCPTCETGQQRHIACHPYLKATLKPPQAPPWRHGGMWGNDGPTGARNGFRHFSLRQSGSGAVSMAAVARPGPAYPGREVAGSGFPSGGFGDPKRVGSAITTLLPEKRFPFKPRDRGGKAVCFP